MNEELKKSSILVRDWDSKKFREISLQEWEAAEKSAGKNSAFAETRAVLSNGKVAGTGWTVEQFLQYRNWPAKSTVDAILYLTVPL